MRGTVGEKKKLKKKNNVEVMLGVKVVRMEKDGKGRNKKDLLAIKIAGK